MYDNIIIFIKDLIATYEVILDLIKINGDSGIINKKRKETYQKAIEIVKKIATTENTTSFTSFTSFTKKLAEILTEKPKKIMQELFENQKVTLENKHPYNGVTIKDRKVIGAEVEIDSFKKLSILVGIGIGIGDSGVKDLVKMGYKSIEELKSIYEHDKFASFRKGLRNPLCKYFEGTVRIEKMPRSEATKWRDTISNIVDNAINNVDIDTDVEIKHKIGGSFARKKEEIGDIDYVVVVNDPDLFKANNNLYKLMNIILDQITEITEIGIDNPALVKLDSVTETPSKPIKDKRYSTSIKLWFKIGDLKTKIEIYGYSNVEFVFPYFARSAEVNLQKKVKIQALKQGYKLSPFGIFNKDDEIIDENIVLQKIGKKITTIKDIFDFLDYKITAS